MSNSIYLVSIAIVLTLFSCKKESEVSSSSNSKEITTYNGDVKKIIDNNCVACHRGDFALELTNYDQVVDWWGRIEQRAVIDGSMPSHLHKTIVRTL
jgi:hypothetical protein